MAHLHEVLDDDLVFEIDDETREIKRISENELILVQGDHNSERCTFKIPKFIDGHNTELCNKVRIHFVNISAENPIEISPGVYETEDLRKSTDDPNSMLVSWVVQKEATVYAGTISFLLEFMCISSDDVLDYSWHTGHYTGGVVLEGMDYSDYIVEKHYDVLDKWIATIEAEGNRVRTDVLARIDAAAKTAEGNAVSSVNNHVEKVKQDLAIHGLSVKDVLVHETGTNKNKIMSQFGVDSELKKLDSKITEERGVLETAFNQLSNTINARLAGSSFYTRVPLDKSMDEDCCVIEIGKTYVIKSNKTASSWGFDISFFATVKTDNEADGEWSTPADIMFNLPTVDQYATDVNTLRILDIIPETDAYGPEDEGISFRIVLEINGERSECRTSVYDHSDRQGTSYTLLNSTIMLYDDTVVTYLINDDPTAKTAVNVNMNGIESIYLHSYEIVDDSFVSTYRIMYTNGDHFDFSVKDGVKINNICLSEHLDYTDSYIIDCSNGEQFFFEVPNSNTVGIETSDSGYSIHAADLIPLEHTIKTKVRSKNLWSYRPNEVVNGVTITTDENGKITFNGTCTKSFVVFASITLEKGTYTLSDNQVGDRPTTIDARTQIYIPDTGLDARIEHHHASNKTVTFTLHERTSGVRLRIKGAQDFTYNNYSISPQLELGNAATPYTPYVNPNEVTLRTCGKNLIKYPHAATDQTVEGVEYTDNGDGTVTVNGTASASSNSIHYLAQTQTSNIHLGPGTYTLSGCPAGGSNGTYRLTIKTNDANPVYYHDFGNGCTFTLDAEKIIYIYICVGQGASADNLLFKPQLEVGDAATEFELYEGNTYPVAGDGTPVYPIRSVPRMTNVLSDKMGVILDVVYNRDNTILTNRLLEQYEANEARFNSKANVTYVDSEIDSVVNKLSEIDSQHNKRISNLEHLIDPEIVHTDDTVAYVKDLPLGALPYAEVTKIGGMTRKCTNLIDGANKTLETHTYKVSITAGDYICVVRNPNGSLDGIKTGVTYAASFRDASGSVIVSGVHNGVTITAEQASQISRLYVAFESAYYTGDFTTVTHQLNRGLVALPYEPYFDGLRSAPVSELVSEGVNLAPVANISGTRIVTYTLPKLYPAGKYTVSMLGTSSATDMLISYKNITTDKSLAVNTYKSGKVSTLTFDADFDFDALVFYGSYDYTASSGIEFTVSNIMLNEGSTALPYRPYFKRTLPIPEAVRAIEGYGVGKNENEYNFVDLENQTIDNGYRVIKLPSDKGGCNSTQNWFYISHDTLGILAPKTKIVCNLLNDEELPNTTTEGIDSTGTHIIIRKSGFTTQAEYRQWLTDNDVYIVEKLADYTPTDISDILTDDNFIEVEGGGSITAENEFSYAVPTEIIYMVKDGDAT